MVQDRYSGWGFGRKSAGGIHASVKDGADDHRGIGDYIEHNMMLGWKTAESPAPLITLAPNEWLAPYEFEDIEESRLV